MGQPILDSDGNPFLDSHGQPFFQSGPLFFPQPRAVMWPVVRQPKWDTLVQRVYSGKTTRVPRQQQAIYQYTLDISVLRIASPFDYQAFVGFVNSLLGQFGSFYYDDPNDDAVTDQIFGIGDGSSTQYQLSRMFGYATDYVFAASGAAPIIKKNGSTLVAGIDYTIDALCLVTFAAAPAADDVLSWTGSYYWLCQCTLDAFALSEFAFQMFELKKFTFETQLLP